MIKDLFSDLFNQRVIDAIKSTVLERLWLLALSMKDKTRLSDCGSVLNKSASGEDYKWGLRFYVLLLECFKQWTIYTEDPDFVQKYNRIKETIPLVEDDYYYPQTITSKLLDHSKVDLLLGQPKREKPQVSPKQQDFQSVQPESKEIQELSKLQQQYFNCLFTKTPDIPLISEQHMILQSYFDSVKTKLSSSSLPAHQKEDISFYRKFANLHLTETIESPKGLAKLRQDICNILQESYGECPTEFQQFLNSNSRPSSQTKLESKKENVFMYHLDNEQNESREKNKVKKSSPPPQVVLSYSDAKPQNRSVSPNRNNYEFNLNDFGDDVPEENVDQIKYENELLQRQKNELANEVETLKGKEKSLSQSMMLKSGLFASHKIDASPEFLIEEINRKNREYEALQAKYQSLISQMNDRVKSDLDKSVSGIGRVDFLTDSSSTWNPRNFDLGKDSRYTGRQKNSGFQKY